VRQTCGLLDLVGRNTARIELLKATTQSGCRYENGDAAAQRLGSSGCCGESGLTLMAVALFHGSISRSRAAASSAPAKFGMRPCGGNGKRATPSAASLSQTHCRAPLLSGKSQAISESGAARPGDSQGRDLTHERVGEINASPAPSGVRRSGPGRDGFWLDLGRVVVLRKRPEFPVSGTNGSNPSSSSGESASRAILPSHGEKPAFRAGVWARQVHPRGSS
jgi:hypothetical protein